MKSYVHYMLYIILNMHKRIHTIDIYVRTMLHLSLQLQVHVKTVSKLCSGPQDVEMEYEMSWQTLRHRLACLDGPGAWLSSSLL